MQTKNSFFAGLEEVFARLLGVVIAFVFFLIYIVAVNQIVLDWVKSLIMLVIFWLTYETLSLILFSVFSFFAKDKKAAAPVENSQVVHNSQPTPDQADQVGNPSQTPMSI